MTMLSPSKPLTALLFTDGSQVTNLGGTPLCLLQQMGKSILERAVEQCVHAGCKTIWIISSAHQHEIEAHLETGERWGCQINYLITRSADQHPLSQHPVLQNDMNYLVGSAISLVHDLHDFVSHQQNALLCDEVDEKWLGWAITTGQWFHNHSVRPDFAVFRECFLADPTLRRVSGKRLLSLTSVDDFYQNICTLLKTADIEQQFGHHLKQHSTAQISGAVYIGNNVTLGEQTKIGPNVIIEDGCYIDSDTSLSDCYVAAYTYIGKNLDVMHKLAIATNIYDVKLKCVNTIQDPWIISTTKNYSKHETQQEQQRTGWFNQLYQPIFKYFNVNNH